MKDHYGDRREEYSRNPVSGAEFDKLFKLIESCINLNKE